MPEKPIRIEADSLRGLAGLLLAEIAAAAETNSEIAADAYEPARRGYAKIAEFAGALSEYRPFLESCLETALENVSDAQEAERIGGENGFCRRCGGALDVDPGGETYCTGCGR